MFKSLTRSAQLRETVKLTVRAWDVITLQHEPKTFTRPDWTFVFFDEIIKKGESATFLKANTFFYFFGCCVR